MRERFFSFLSIGPDCWYWSGAKTGQGYGAIDAVGGRPVMGAHRVAYELANGPIPEGMCIIHTCDTRDCVRPTHLRLGTFKDNSEDMVAKGRSTAGRNGNRKVDLAIVREIRASKPGTRGLAKKFGITKEQVRNIRLRLQWQRAE